MERFFKKPLMVAELRCGPLAGYLDVIANELSKDSYAVCTARFQLLVTSDFSRWLEMNRIQLKEMTLKHAEMYMRYRDERRLGKRADAEAALNRLVELLHRLGVLSDDKPAATTEVDEVTQKFATYLLEQRGLSAKTVDGYRRFALRFLGDLAVEGKFDPSSLSAVNIFDFVQKMVPTRSGTRGRDMVNALRSFLRFARYQEYVNTDLAAVVPRVANWSQTSLPKTIPPDQVERVLSSCDRMTRYGKRDYAILILLARLGLRVGEVVSLCLDDINWETGVITIHGKTGLRVLPLPNDVGEALTQYLCEVRPQVNTRAVFLRLRAPVRAMKTQETVCGVVRRAMERARIRSPKKGAHQFRHGLATELLRKGASLPEIGEILGHQQRASTMIYAKVDLKSLQKLAMPWPGGAQ